jgi:hypothetical protein
MNLRTPGNGALRFAATDYTEQNIFSVISVKFVAAININRLTGILERRYVGIVDCKLNLPVIFLN